MNNRERHNAIIDKRKETGKPVTCSCVWCGKEYEFADLQIDSPFHCSEYCEDAHWMEEHA